MNNKVQREAYIRASDQRVAKWVNSKRNAFKEAVARITGQPSEYKNLFEQQELEKKEKGDSMTKANRKPELMKILPEGDILYPCEFCNATHVEIDGRVKKVFVSTLDYRVIRLADGKWLSISDFQKAQERGLISKYQFYTPIGMTGKRFNALSVGDLLRSPDGVKVKVTHLAFTRDGQELIITEAGVFTYETCGDWIFIERK